MQLGRRFCPSCDRISRTKSTSTEGIMKAFNLSNTAVQSVARRDMTVLILGEPGRGRKQIAIPCPEGIKDGEDVTFSGGGTTPQGIKRKTKIELGDDGKKVWLARVSTAGAYIRGANGGASTQPQYGVKTLELAHGAFGDAGRIGIWRDYLAVIPFGSILRVKPSRGDCYYLWFEEDKVSKLTADELELLDLEYPMEGRVQLGDLL